MNICPIFDRCERDKITLVGAWMMHPVNFETMPSGIRFTLGHVGPMLARYFGDEPYRQIPNAVSDVGRGCRFVGGAFWMGHNHPAPNERGGRPGIEFEYVLKRNAGTTICVRTRKLPIQSWGLKEMVLRVSLRHAGEAQRLGGLAAAVVARIQRVAAHRARWEHLEGRVRFLGNLHHRVCRLVGGDPGVQHSEQIGLVDCRAGYVDDRSAVIGVKNIHTDG
jgi:hypothetical protein